MEGDNYKLKIPHNKEGKKEWVTFDIRHFVKWYENEIVEKCFALSKYSDAQRFHKGDIHTVQQSEIAAFNRNTKIGNSGCSGTGGNRRGGQFSYNSN